MTLERLDELNCMLNVSRTSFLAAAEQYRARSPQLERRCKDHLQKYVNDSKRSPTIQGSAQRSLGLIGMFAGTRSSIVSIIANVSIAMEATAGSIAVSVMEDAFAALSAVGRAGTLSPDTYVTRAEAATFIACQCMDLATPIYSLRLAGLSQFLGETEETDALDFAQAIVRVTSRNGWNAISSKLIDMEFPGLSLLADAQKFIEDVKKEVAKREMIYSGRNDVDDLLDFEAWLNQQSLVLAALMDALRKDEAALIAGSS